MEAFENTGAENARLQRERVHLSPTPQMTVQCNVSFERFSVEGGKLFETDSVDAKVLLRFR